MGPPDYHAMVQALMGLGAVPVADKFNPLAEQMNPSAGLEGARVYPGGRGFSPVTMSNSQINKMLDKLDKQGTKINDELLASGRGHEKPSETLQKSDPLSMRFRERYDQSSVLRDEILRRYGSDITRLPTRR